MARFTSSPSGDGKRLTITDTDTDMVMDVDTNDPPMAPDRWIIAVLCVLNDNGHLIPGMPAEPDSFSPALNGGSYGGGSL